MFRISKEKQIYILNAKISDITRDKKLHPDDKKQLTSFYRTKLREAKK